MADAPSTFTGECSIKIPDHELVRLIGRGSYGEVWLARNIMGTYRAVKIIRRSAFDSDSPFDRELAGIKKFEPISRTHGGFVDILQIGRNRDERCLYYVMEAADDLDSGQVIDPDKYIPRTLGKALSRAKRFSVEQCVQMGLALCQALEHLHNNGLVHRDIKPSNIVFVNGVPKLADIGLVTESNNAHSFVGTEGFIPPEGPGSEQADIFSLGKALYEIASGRDRLDFPSLPPGLSEFPDGGQFLELNECLIRACRLDPKQRYGSAREMYEDLALLASGKSLRRLRILERRWNSVKKTAALSAAVFTVGAMIVWPLVRERQHADEIRERQIGVRSANGINKLDQGDLAGALGEFSEIYNLESQNKKRFSANQTRVASILANTPKLTQMLFLQSRVSAVAFGRDDQQLLTVEKGKRIQLQNVSSASSIAALDSNGASYASFSPDGRLIVVADESGWATIWDLTSGQSERLEHSGNVMCARFSSSGKFIATACNDRLVRLWDAASKKLLFTCAGHSATVRSVVFSQDEKLLASTSNDGSARLWSVTTGQPVGRPMLHPSWVGDVCFNHDSTLLLTAGYDRWVRLWKVSTCEELPTLMLHDDLVTQVAYSPDGSTILTASNDSTVRLWNSKTTLPLPRNHVLRHSSGVFSAAFNSDGHLIATGCADGTVRLWDLAAADFEPEQLEGALNDTGALAASILPGAIELYNPGMPDQTNRHRISVEGAIRELALSANGQSVAAAVTVSNSFARIYAWRLNPNDSPWQLSTTDQVKALKFSPDGSLLAIRTATTNSAVTRVFDIASGNEWSLPPEFSHSSVFAFHPTRRRLAVGAGDSVAVLENLQSTPVYSLLTVSGNVHHLAFSGDGGLLLVSQSDLSISPKSAILFDADSGKPTGVELWHRDGVLAGAFLSNGGRIVTGGEDREALTWDIVSGREILPPLAHREQVSTVSFSPDGRWIGTASTDNSARIWDGETGFPLAPPLLCGKTPTHIVFLPDKQRIATIISSTRALIWKLPATDMSPADAVALSHLLNSDLRVVGEPGTKRIEVMWSSLKQKFPDRFSSNKRQRAQWHTRQLQIAASQHHENAAAFHRARLTALQSEAELDSSNPASKPSVAAVLP